MPETTIFLGEEVDSMQKKIKTSFSGGASTLEEHRRLGGDPDIDVAFQYLKFFFEEDDGRLAEIESSYRSGQMLSGEMKQLCSDAAVEWMQDLAEKRAACKDSLDEFIASDSK
jgi:tryptophanyl-tRNA synthetase